MHTRRPPAGGGYYFMAGGNGNEYRTEIQSPYYDTTVCNFWKTETG